MTNEAWTKGLALLGVDLRDRDLTPEMLQLRGDSYRRRLGHLGDEQWLYAVNAALDQLDWYPTIHELLELAADAPPPATSGLLAGKTLEQLELDREEAKAVYARIRPHLIDIGLVEPLKPMSAELDPEEWDRRRREQLQRFRESGALA